MGEGTIPAEAKGSRVLLGTHLAGCGFLPAMLISGFATQAAKRPALLDDCFVFCSGRLQPPWLGKPHQVPHAPRGGEPWLGLGSASRNRNQKKPLASQAWKLLPRNFA